MVVNMLRSSVTLLLALTLAAAPGCIHSPIVDAHTAFVQRDVQSLIALLSHPDDWVVEDCATYLGLLAAPASASQLHNVLQRPGIHPQTRMAVVRALGRIGLPDSVDDLAQQLSLEAHPSMPLVVVQALGTICSRQAVDILGDLGESNDILTARAAQAAMLRCQTGGRP